MASNYEKFFDADKFAIVGNSSKIKFPVLSYRGLKDLSKTVYPVDPSVPSIDGDKTYKTLGDLPEKVERVIIEVPKKETVNWIKEIISAEIQDAWIHMGCDTQEAIKLAKDNNINLRTGTCAVMYVTPGPSYHSIHKWIMKILGKY